MADANRVRVVWSGVPGSPFYSNFYSLTPAVTATVAHDAVVALVTALKPAVIAQITATVEGDVSIIDDATGGTVGVDAVPTVAVPMSGTGTALPPASQGLVRILTGAFIGGRQVRGRMNIPGPRTSDSEPIGTPMSGYKSLLQDAFEDYLTAVGPAAVVYSRKNTTFVPIASVSVWDQWAVLRSRRD